MEKLRVVGLFQPVVLRARGWFILIILLLLLCIITGIGVLLIQPRTYSNHHDVIIAMLAQRGIHPLQVSTNPPWPDTVNYYAYGSQVYPYHLNVEVNLVDGRIISGNVECHRDVYECQLTIMNLGFDRVAMPNIRTSRPNKLIEWLEQLFANVSVTFLVYVNYFGNSMFNFDPDYVRNLAQV